MTQEEHCIDYAKRVIANRKGYDYIPSPSELEVEIYSFLVDFGEEHEDAKAYIEIIKSKTNDLAKL